MTLSDANKLLGFWRSCGFIDLDKGNVWPREYRWACTCLGVSRDGESVVIAPCSKHDEQIEVPDWLDVEQVRQAAFQRKPIGDTSMQEFPAGDGMSARERRAFVDVFDKRGRHHGRSKDKR